MRTYLPIQWTAYYAKNEYGENKEGIEKKVKRDILQQYLDEGWQLGGKKRK